MPSFLPAQPLPLRCHTSEIYQDYYANNLAFEKEKEALEQFTERWIKENKQAASNRTIFTIPVVVHVVWKEAEENISDEQIRSQIDVLNQDFRLRNTDLDNIPDEFAHLAADIEIEFCLASIDYEGNPTTGITRQFTTVSGIASRFDTNNNRIVKNSSLGGTDAWNPQEYLNIWVATYIDNLLGDATYPGQTFPDEDGVVVTPQHFGTEGTAATSMPFHLGRTCTHEVGHYFNLRHPWGDFQINCLDDDCVSDTPVQGEIYEACPSHPQNSCGSNDLFMNYMNLVTDECMHLFTTGQKWRMLAALNGPRSGLLSSNGCGNGKAALPSILTNTYTIFPNPAQSILNINLESNDGLELLNLLTADGKLAQGCHFLSSGKLHSLDVSAVPAGIYFLHIRQKGNSIYEKVVVAK